MFAASIRASLCLLATVAVAHADLVQVDDTTAYDAELGVFVDRAVEAPLLADGAPPASPPVAALDDGIVGCSTTDTANPFALATSTPLTSINLLPEGNYPYDATINPTGTEVWIPGASGDGVIVIDRATNAIAQRITVGDYPISVAFTLDGTRALVANRSSRDISVVSTATYDVIATLDLGLTSGFGVGNLALDPTTGTIWGVRWFGTDLYEIAADGSAVLDVHPIGDSLWQVVVDPAGEYVYCTDRGTDQVHVFDPSTDMVFTSVAVGDDPWGLDVRGDGTTLVVACEDDATVHFINTNGFTATSIPLDAAADPRDVDILDVTDRAYVVGGTTPSGSPVYLIDLESNTIDSSFDALDTNTNVVAVQAQVGGGTTAVAAAPAPGVAGVTLGATPNPFNPRTLVSYTVPAAGDVRLDVFDVSGRLVTRLVDARRTAGEHRTVWTGRGATGEAVAGGVYFLRLEMPRASRITKVVLAK